MTRLLRVTGLALALIICLALAAAAQDEAPPSDQEAAPPPGEEITGEMVLISGGVFQMGSDVEDDHQPIHEVQVDSFYLDKYEVTCARYQRFCEATDHDLPIYWGMEKFHCGPDFPDHPMVGVTWADAEAYAEWAGKRMPTEAEWEYAACGGLEGMKFPGGDDVDSTLVNYGKKLGGTVPVGSLPANGYGLYETSGNVGEWVADCYDPDYYAESPRENPTGPEECKYRVVRGGGWYSGKYCNRVYRRLGLLKHWVDFNVGFRSENGQTRRPAVIILAA